MTELQLFLLIVLITYCGLGGILYSQDRRIERLEDKISDLIMKR